MRRFLPQTFNQWLLASVPLSLVFACVTGLWTLGAAAALGALCSLAVRSPQQEFVERWPWLARYFPGQFPTAQTKSEQPNKFSSLPTLPPPRRRPPKDSSATPVEQMIAKGRVALLLRPQIAPNLSSADLERSQDALDEAMAIVPQGPVAIRPRCFDLLDEETAARAERLIQVEGLFLDRYAVSNRDYLEFVEDGGYEEMSLWDEAIWPAVLGFVDRTGQPGPRYWENSIFPKGHDDHPVVGVSWYEASAYARWAGKRLPTDPEWVKAASWPVIAESPKPVQRRFPWGDSMDRRKANIWGSGFDHTIAAHALPEGASLNGVLQLVGNTWEWTSSTFGAWEPAGHKIETTMPLKSIRGGAFDTYFETQSHCQFQSGESPLSRRHNIGFRCALGFCDVVNTTEHDQPRHAQQAHAASPSPAETENEEVLV
jgi:gamma-glutamyl hercynylcysteine S-oxide synthase